MKIKILIALSLAAVFCLSGCKGETNTNTTNVTTNTANANVAVVKTPESAKTDPAMQKKVEDALKAKGFDKVEIDTSTTPATLRGTVAKGKLAEAYQTAQEAAGKPLTNQITEEK